MLGLTAALNPRFVIRNAKIEAPRPLFRNLSQSSRFQFRVCIRPVSHRSTNRKFVGLAEGDERKSDAGGIGNDGELKTEKENQRPKFNPNWTELLLNPDPDNVAAVGLTGLLTWASAQVVWQLVIVSLSILVAALKYSFVAALLIIILITLL